jgi:hypothetical protein
VQTNSEALPIGSLVMITGEDFFATCAGNIGIVVKLVVAKAGDLHVVLVNGSMIAARADQLTLVTNSGA